MGAKVTYAYRTPGTYRVGLVVTDDSRTSTNTAEDELTVVVNAPPVADAGPDQLVTASEVSFDGGGSSDPDGVIARYDWEFGDGATGTGRTTSHVYRKVGAYTVRLTVTDDSGTVRSSASDALRVLVNAAPIADAGPDQVAAPGQTLTFSGQGSLDPDGDIAVWQWSSATGRLRRASGVAPLCAAGNLPRAPDRARRYRPAGRGRLRRGGGVRQRAAAGAGRAGPDGGAGRRGQSERLQFVRSGRYQSRLSAGTSATSKPRPRGASRRGGTTGRGPIPRS